MVALGTGTIYAAGRFYYRTFYDVVYVPRTLIEHSFADYMLAGVLKTGASLVGAVFFAIVLAAFVLVLVESIRVEVLRRRGVRVAPRLDRFKPGLAVFFFLGPVSLFIAAGALDSWTKYVADVEELVRPFNPIGVVSLAAGSVLFLEATYRDEVFSKIKPWFESRHTVLTIARGVRNLVSAGAALAVMVALLLGVSSLAISQGTADGLAVVVGESSAVPAVVIKMVDGQHELNGRTAYVVAESAGLYHFVIPDCNKVRVPLVISVRGEEVSQLESTARPKVCPETTPP